MRTPLHLKHLLALSAACFVLPVIATADEASSEDDHNIDMIVSEAQEMAKEWAYRIREWSREGDASSTYMGVVIESVPKVLRDYIDLPDGVGLLLSRIASESPAERAGLMDNDIIVLFDGQLIINYDQFSTLIDLKGPGVEIPLQVLRKGEEVNLTIVLEERTRKGSKTRVPNVPEPPQIIDGDELGSIMQSIEEWIPGSVKIMVDDTEQVHVDIEDLKEDMDDLKTKVLKLTASGTPAPEIIKEYGDLGARTTVVHMKDRNINYQSDAGKLVIQSSEAGQQAMVWNREGDLLYQGELADDYEQTVPEEAAELIKAYFDSRNKLQLEANGEPLEIHLNQETAVPVTMRHS